MGKNWEITLMGEKTFRKKELRLEVVILTFFLVLFFTLILRFELSKGLTKIAPGT